MHSAVSSPPAPRALAGLAAFRLVCLAQLIARLGSELTGFALGVWFYRRTGLISVNSLLAGATYLPQLLLAPLAGAIVDRFSRRTALLVGHAGAGVCSLALLVCVRAGLTDIATVVGLVVLASACRAAEIPAFSALTTELVAAEQRDRANGLAALSYALPQLAAPVLAGLLVDGLGLDAILVLDTASFVIAIGLLALVPATPPLRAVRDARVPLAGQLLDGWRYLRRHPGLAWLTGFLAVMKWNGGMLLVLLTPFVLGFADARSLGLVRSLGGLGMLAGALWVALRGAPRRRLHGVLGGAALQGALLAVLGLHPQVPLAALACFVMLFCTPLMSACNESIWQGRVPPELQGRVFAFRGMLAGAALPLALAAAGPLVDVAFAPIAGDGRGAGLLLATLGVLTLVLALAALASPRLRALEETRFLLSAYSLLEGRTTMYTTNAWILKMGDEQSPGPGQLEPGRVSFAELGEDEVLVEPLIASWEGNSYHALQRDPIDVCRVRGEPQVVIGNAGVVRVLRPGAARSGLAEGDVCLLQGNYKPDRFGYLENGGAFGYDAKGTVGLLAKQTKIRASCLVPVPKDTRHTLEQWAAFSIRYITAWANWRVAYGTWRLQVTEDDQATPHVWGWGGGTSFAELTLARRFGAQACMIASQPGRLALAESHGLRPIDRRRFPNIVLDERRLGEPGYEDLYRASEKLFLQAVKQATDGQGVSIFVDYVGAPVLRATLRALAREGVLTTAGWREGMRTNLVRSLECIQRHQHIHTHYARRSEVEAAMAYGERTGWMPPLGANEQPWAFDAVPQLVEEYLAGRIESYFPLVRVNR